MSLAKGVVFKGTVTVKNTGSTEKAPQRFSNKLPCIPGADLHHVNAQRHYHPYRAPI